MNKTEAILQRAYELVANGWCQGASARDRDGNVVSWDSDNACRWCLTGAISKGWADQYSDVDAAYRATFREKPSMIGAARDAVRDAIGPVKSGRFSLSTWNDNPGTNQAQVMRVLKRAILTEGEKC